MLAVGATCSWARLTSRALRSISCWMPRAMARWDSSRSKARVAAIWLADARFSAALARSVSESMLGLTRKTLSVGCSAGAAFEACGGLGVTLYMAELL